MGYLEVVFGILDNCFVFLKSSCFLIEVFCWLFLMVNNWWELFICFNLDKGFLGVEEIFVWVFLVCCDKIVFVKFFKREL